MIPVVILNWNGAKLLREYLPEVIANTNPEIGRIIVADNGSTDDSRRLLADEFPDVETILLDKNYGFADGYNRVISTLDEPSVLLLNSDVAPAPGWLEPLARFFDSNPDVGACQPKILSRVQPSRFEYAGAAGGFLDRNGYPYCRGRIFGTCETDNAQYDTVADIDWASGAALLVRTDLYKRLGGLDPEFFAHMEEIDLCWRIRSAGFRICCVPQSVVYHLGGGSLPQSNPRKTFLNFRNNLLMLHKNLPDSSRKSTLLRRRLLDTIAWAKDVATFHWANAAAIFRAHRSFARIKHNFPTSPDTPDLLVGRPNILTQYYLKRRKHFSSLP